MNTETEQVFLVNSASNAVIIQKNDSAPGTSAAPVNLEDVQDFSTVCRTCATITEFVIPIFEGEGLQNNLADKIQKHLPIRVLENDALPRVVCYQCASTLLAWHELVKCCEQAENALKARLAQLQPTTSTQSLESGWESSKNDQNKSPPRSADAGTSSRPATALRCCPYCRSQRPEPQHREHLIDAHADLLFHCQECDNYVDKKDFLLHMTFHCVLLSKASEQDKNETRTPERVVKTEPPKRANPEAPRKNVRTELPRKVKTEPQRKSKTEPKRATRRIQVEPTDENENRTRPKKKITFAVKKAPDAATNKADNNNIPRKQTDKSTDDAENDFSDHSDADYGFGPLPESVFDAIEDSQDKAPDERASPSEGNQTLNSQSNTAENKIENGKIPDHKKPRTCPICSKTYTASSSYFYHLKYFHRKSKEHACSVCGRKFGTRAGREQHAALHSGDSPLACERCGKRFRTKASLYIHSQTHANNVGSKCGVCGRVFRWRAALQRHAARHAGARAHACDTCGRAFSVRCDLIRHARTHERGEFACERCSTTFAQPRYLRVHLLKKHGIKPAKESQIAA